MRTSLLLPKELVDEARRTLGFTSTTETVVCALREVVRRGRNEDLKAMLGTVKFTFDPTVLRKRDRNRIRPLSELLDDQREDRPLLPPRRRRMGSVPR